MIRVSLWLCLSLTTFLQHWPLAAVEITQQVYEGREQFKITTKQAVWYYDLAGGGFSRLIDADGRDWISFSKQPLKEFPDSAAAGYRGLGNLVHLGDDGGVGHPGFDKCVSEKVNDHTIRTRSKSGKWEWTWTFRDHAATFHMHKADPDVKWWFLYEGPIAGKYAPKRQYWGTDKGGPNSSMPHIGDKHFDTWRWTYFGQRDVDRVLFVTQHKQDKLPDTIWYLGNQNGGAIDSQDGMIVFGLGRGPGGINPQFQGAGVKITVGLLERGVRSKAEHGLFAARIRTLLDTANKTPRDHVERAGDDPSIVR